MSWGIAIHTGAGRFTLASLGDRVAPMRAAMTEALVAGYNLLAAGGSSLDAVEAAVVVLEDTPFFNAGKGSVFTRDATHELDASIVDGRTRRAGAVAGIKTIRNPIRLARLVMEQSPHVMLVAGGAEAFAREHGLEVVAADYFSIERAWDQLRSAQSGTVGAVALDREGNLAAATSTGGMTNKRAGRVGDSAVIGAGTYASNQRCAISATGQGEYFIRFAVAHDIFARVVYTGASLQSAADAVVREIGEAGGDGGVIGIDPAGHIAVACNVSGMGHGSMGADGEVRIAFTV